ncbi:SDR family oxidoreductase [Fodinicola acaciae]|uniref:SDR family oxidoreductase n=1 Tax=Fodinicola acaciae TaxID=2681555 RepID=UPI0013D78717|nr:NAD(P)H-binding protein [Fodinicola acaciae]
MTRREPVLVVGATGSVGRAVVKALLARRATVRVLVRDPAKVAELPSSVQRHIGDLRFVDGLQEALLGVGAAFYVSPHDPEEIRLASTFVRACEAGGIRIVFAGVHLTGRHDLMRLLKRTAFSLALPRYRGKLRVGELMANSTTRPVVLAVSNFMQNDEVFLEDILGGVFPEPLAAAGVNRVDLRDVADIAADALLRPRFPAGAYPVVGPASLSGVDCARHWSQALDRPVRYGGHDRGWEAVYRRRLSGPKLDDWISTFRVLRRHGLATSDDALACTTGLLGRMPRSYATYVRDITTAIMAG